MTRKELRDFVLMIVSIEAAHVGFVLLVVGLMEVTGVT